MLPALVEVPSDKLRMASSSACILSGQDGLGITCQCLPAGLLQWGLGEVRGRAQKRRKAMRVAMSAHVR